MFSTLGTSSNLSYLFFCNNVKIILNQNGDLILLWIVNYWFLHVSMVREPKLMMMSLQKKNQWWWYCLTGSQGYFHSLLIICSCEMKELKWNISEDKVILSWFLFPLLSQLQSHGALHHKASHHEAIHGSNQWKQHSLNLNWFRTWKMSAKNVTREMSGRNLGGKRKQTERG